MVWQKLPQGVRDRSKYRCPLGGSSTADSPTRVFEGHAMVFVYFEWGVILRVWCVGLLYIRGSF